MESGVDPLDPGTVYAEATGATNVEFCALLLGKISCGMHQ